jgi:hypothetical protein
MLVLSLAGEAGFVVALVGSSINDGGRLRRGCARGIALH